MFSPLPSIVDEADHVADMGAYFPVHKDDEEILVRVQGEEIFEETVTDKLDKKSEKVFVYDGNQYAVFKELISGKTIFTLNI